MWDTENILFSSLLEDSRSANDVYNVMKNMQAQSNKHIHHTDSFQKEAKGFNTIVDIIPSTKIFFVFVQVYFDA